MSTTIRYDAQYCPIARALDVLGDRWTLLILREIVSAPRRFSELRRALPGIAATVLSQRLRALEDQALIVALAPDGSARHEYRITPRGQETIPVMRALARFGMPLLGEPDEADVTATTAINAAIVSYHDPVAAHGTNDHYRFVVDDTTRTVSSTTGLSIMSDHADATIESDATVWFDIRHGRNSFDKAVDAGRIRVAGDHAAIGRLRAIFDLDG